MLDAIAIVGVILLTIFIVSIILVKKGVLGDRDADGIADVIEDSVEEIQGKVKEVKSKLKK